MQPKKGGTRRNIKSHAVIATVGALLANAYHAVDGVSLENILCKKKKKLLLIKKLKNECRIQLDLKIPKVSREENLTKTAIQNESNIITSWSYCPLVAH